VQTADIKKRIKQRNADTTHFYALTQGPQAGTGGFLHFSTKLSILDGVEERQVMVP
jgi:hypothetical protein